MTNEHVQNMTLEEHYAQAGGYYRQFQDEFALAQDALGQGDWFAYSIYQDIKPGGGASLSDAPVGEARAHERGGRSYRRTIL